MKFTVINKKVIIFIIFIIQICFSEAQSNTKIYKEISKDEQNFILKYQKK